MSFRKVIFWVHLVLGLASGLVIATMAITGAAMAFEKQLTAWAERDVRRVTFVTNERWSVQDMVQAVRDELPEARPQSIVVSSDPTAAVAIALNRTNTVYVNPYTGEVRASGAAKTRAFFQFMLKVHRWLGVAPQQQSQGNQSPPPQTGLRAFTSTVVGISVCIFLVLCISGLILWWPRNWRALRLVIWFMRGQRGKARDWNWHNVFGFWSLPVLIVITCTGIIMHFRSVGDWIYPRQENGASDVKISTPESGTRPLGPDDLITAAKTAAPDWDTITLRFGGRRGRGGSGEVRGPQPVSISVTEHGWSPVPVDLTLDPFTGEVLRKESLADFGFRRGLRALVRPLHTGDWGGWFGQLLAMLAALGAVMLVWTGFALSWRRFFKRG